MSYTAHHRRSLLHQQDKTTLLAARYLRRRSVNGPLLSCALHKAAEPGHRCSTTGRRLCPPTLVLHGRRGSRALKKLTNTRDRPVPRATC